MTLDIGLTLGMILMALALFATEKLRVDLIALIVLLSVSISGLVPKEEVFLGFANSAVITIWAVYIVSGGLFKTGIADMLGSFIIAVLPMKILPMDDIFTYYRLLWLSTQKPVLGCVPLLWLEF